MYDWVMANTTFKTGCPGSKPEKFCFWLFEILGMEPGDELVDIFPGSGAVMRAWENFQKQRPLRDRDCRKSEAIPCLI